MTGRTMTGKHAGIALAGLLGVLATAPPALAQNEQFIPMLVYRTGAYAPNGVPFANGLADYYNLINERDGGINGVKIVFEECDTGYATDRGVECYERLKGKGPTGAAYVIPLSTGITFARSSSDRRVSPADASAITGSRSHATNPGIGHDGHVHAAQRVIRERRAPARRGWRRWWWGSARPAA